MTAHTPDAIQTKPISVTAAGLAGSDAQAVRGNLSSISQRAMQDVFNVFSNPEHQAHEDSVETMIVLNSCLPLDHADRVDNSIAIREAQSRGLLKRPVAKRLEGNSSGRHYARGC